MSLINHLLWLQWTGKNTGFCNENNAVSRQKMVILN